MPIDATWPHIWEVSVLAVSSLPSSEFSKWMLGIMEVTVNTVKANMVITMEQVASIC